MNDIQKSILLSQITKPGIQKADPRVSNSPNSKSISESSDSFDSALNQAQVQFSKHAEKRLNLRNIELSSAEKTKLETAMGSLEKKGARDSLILMGELAFIVNVPSKTVVTALTKDQMKEQVFTNIDSTMLVNA